MYGPDFDSDDGLSDDNDYDDFRNILAQRRLENVRNYQSTHNGQNQEQKIYHAIIGDNVDVVLNELHKGFNIETKLEGSWTLLLLSTSCGSIKVSHELIKQGANLHVCRDTDSATVLMLASASNKNTVEIVKELVEKGCDPNEIDNKRKTALMYAAQSGDIEVVKFLLGVSQKDAVDNQKWTPLFWAVDGNQLEIVRLLLENGFNAEQPDIRNRTPIDYALQNEQEDILQLFPKKIENDYFDENIFSKKILNFEDIFNKLKNNEKPNFFEDICKILYGSRTEHLIPIFRDVNINLLNFLSLSNKEIKEYGILLPYQRYRIMNGLYKFHCHAFNPKSILVLPRNQIYSNITIGSNLLSAIKQIIAMEASLIFILKNQKIPKNQFDKQSINSINKIKHDIQRLKNIVKQLTKQTAMWDATLRPVDLITKPTSKSWSKTILNTSLMGVVIYIFIRQCT